MIARPRNKIQFPQRSFYGPVPVLRLCFSEPLGWQLEKTLSRDLKDPIKFSFPIGIPISQLRKQWFDHNRLKLSSVRSSYDVSGVRLSKEFPNIAEIIENIRVHHPPSTTDPWSELDTNISGPLLS